MASAKGKKKSKPKGKMSAKRLAAVQRIEGKNTPEATAQSVTPSQDANLAPTPASSKAASLIQKAHSLGLSVAANASESGVQKLLNQFEILRKLTQDVWGEIYTGSAELDSDEKFSRRLNLVVSGFFEDGRTLCDLLEAANASACPGKAKRQISNALYNEFPDLLDRPGFLSRLFKP